MDTIMDEQPAVECPAEPTHESHLSSGGNGLHTSEDSSTAMDGAGLSFVGMNTIRDIPPSSIKIEDEMDNPSPEERDGNRTCPLLTEAHPSRNASLPPIKVEEQTGEASQRGRNEHGKNDNPGSDGEAPRDSAEGPKNYVGAAMVEIQSRKHGRLYKPEEHEPQRVLISSLDQFRECGEMCNKIVDDLKEQLKAVGNSQHVLQSLEKARFSEVGKHKRIGLQGPAGSGKSSLLNALLNIPDLAPTDCGANACTVFPIEYTSPKPGQAQNILICIQLFNQQERHDLLKEALQTYRQEMEKAASENADDGELERDEESCKGIISMFSALFVNKHAFMGNDDKLRDFLCQKPLDTVLVQMKQWLTELLPAGKIDSEEICLNAASATELTALLEPYVGKPDTMSSIHPSTSLWPVIKSITIHVASMILNSGITLVDVPGLSDTNRHRVKVSESCLSKCSHVIVVATGRRVHSDRDVKDHIERAARRVGSDMIVAITHNDQTSQSTATAARYKSDERMIEIDNNIKSLAERKRMLQQDQSGERSQLEEEEQLLYGVKLGLQLELCAKDMEEHMRKTYSRMISNKTVDIISVSNTLYTDSTNANCRPTVSPPPVRTTGIPMLRKAVRKFGEKPIILHLYEHIHSVLPNALQRVRLWCNPMEVDLSATASPALQDSMAGCRSILDQLGRTLQNLVHKHVVRAIEENMPAWMVESRRLVERYVAKRYRGRPVSVRSTNSFIIKHGRHTRSGEASVDINALLIQHVADHLDQALRNLKDEIQECLRQVGHSLIENCSSLFERIENGATFLILADKRAALNEARKSYEKRIAITLRAATLISEYFVRSLRVFSTGTEGDGCIMVILDPIYDRLVEAYPGGKGYCCDRRDAFYKYLHSNMLYMDYRDLVSDRGHTSLQAFLDENVRSKIEFVFKEMHAGLKDFCMPPELSEEEKTRRAGILASIVQHTETLNNVQKEFHQCCDTGVRTTTDTGSSSQSGQKRKRNDEDPRDEQPTQEIV